MILINKTKYNFLLNGDERVILPMTPQMMNYQYNTSELSAAETLINLQFTTTTMTTKPLHSDINDGTPMTVPVSNISPMTSFYIPFLSYKNCQDKNDEISEGSSDNSTWLKKQSSGDMDYYIGNSEEEDYDDNENKKEDDGEAEISDKNKGDEYEGVNNAVNNEKKDNKKKVNNSERSYRHKPRLASSPYPTTVTQNDQHNNITKPRWSNKERSKLLLAVIKEKQLDKLSTFRWKVISKHLNSKRSSNSCRYQWKNELLPMIKSIYD